MFETESKLQWNTDEIYLLFIIPVVYQSMNINKQSYNIYYIFIIINFVCTAANLTPYTIRNKSLGLIRRVHRDDTRSVRREGPIVDWRDENQRVERTEDLENLRSSINTNKSLNFDLSSLYDVAKNITKAENKTL